MAVDVKKTIIMSGMDMMVEFEPDMSILCLCSLPNAVKRGVNGWRRCGRSEERVLINEEALSTGRQRWRTAGPRDSVMAPACHVCHADGLEIMCSKVRASNRVDSATQCPPEIFPTRFG